MTTAKFCSGKPFTVDDMARELLEEAESLVGPPNHPRRSREELRQAVSHMYSKVIEILDGLESPAELKELIKLVDDIIKDEKAALDQQRSQINICINRLKVLKERGELPPQVVEMVARAIPAKMTVVEGGRNDEAN